MKRSEPPKRKKPLARGKPPARKKPLPKVSRIRDTPAPATAIITAISTPNSTTRRGVTRSEPVTGTAIRTGIRSGSGGNSAAGFRKRKPAKDDAAARRFRKAVIARAGGRCEACPVMIDAARRIPDGAVDAKVVARAVRIARACRGAATQAHHRCPRGLGGHGDNRPENGIAACDASHEWIESFRTAAYALGLLERHGR